MFQLIISHTVNRHFGLGTFLTGHFQRRMFHTPFVGSITKYHSSVQHVSLEFRYSFFGLGSIRDRVGYENTDHSLPKVRVS